MRAKKVHKLYCFAGQAAPVTGYFKGDVLPCVCKGKNVMAALAQVAIPQLPRARPCNSRKNAS
jgi:hypothetical protein